MNDLKPKTAAIVVIIFILAIIASALYDIQPPKPLPANAPDSLFSADRAAGFIREIARTPHPLGSIADSIVRQYICRQLNSIGLRAALDTTVVTGSFDGIHYAGYVINIVARLVGTSNTKAVLLMAHYDSVPTGPGASDDASGVATVLETLRALRSSPPLKNDIVAVFTDGEEPGMLGGQALSEDDSLLNGVGVALNFEARGTNGPTLMFETSPDEMTGNGNGWLIKQLDSSCANPVATSISGEVYKHLPNNTDFSWLKAKKVPGLNFAFIGGLVRYHTELDNYSHISEASIQHDGNYALSLVKAFGETRLPGPKFVNYVYFNFFWPGFVIYPSTMITAITFLAVIIFLLTVYVGTRKSVISLKKSLISLAFSILPIAILTSGTYFLWKFVQSDHPESAHFVFGSFYGEGIYLSAIILLVTGLTSAFYIFFRRFFRSSEMAIGTLFWWFIATILSTRYFPEGAYFFQWPLIFSSLALLIFFLTPKSDFRSPTVMLTLLICSIPGLYLTSETVYLVYLTGLLPVTAAAVALMIVMGLGTILPHIAIIASPNKWLFPIGIFAVGLIVAALAVFTHRIDESHPMTDSIDYAIDMNDSAACWISFDDSTDEWTSQFIPHPSPDDTSPEFFPNWWKSPKMWARAVAVPLQPVSVKLVGDTASHAAQFMTFRVRPPHAAYHVILTTDPVTQVLSSSVDGVEVPDSVSIFPKGKKDRWTLHFYGMPDSGTTVTLVIPAGQYVKLTTIGICDGLPKSTGLPRHPRPASIIMRPFVTTDASVVMKSYTF